MKRIIQEAATAAFKDACGRPVSRSLYLLHCSRLRRALPRHWWCDGSPLTLSYFRLGLTDRSAFSKHPFVTHLPLLINPSVDRFSCQPVGHSRIYQTVFNLNLSGIVPGPPFVHSGNELQPYRFAPTTVAGIRNGGRWDNHGIKSRVVLPFTYACETFCCPLRRASKGLPASTT